MSFDLELLKKIRCRILDRSNGKPVAGVVASLAVSIGEADKPVRIPVGTLRSDATGYLSFDLKPLVDLGLQTASGLLISAPCAGLQNHNLLETLAASRRIEGDSNLRVALPSHLQSEKDAKRQPLCVVFPVYVEKPKHNHGSCDCDSRCHAADLVSIQSPDACDYEVSPYSFVNPTKINFGGDCCETLVPSTLPVQEHGFYKVVVRREASDKMASIGGRIDREVRVTGELESQKNRSIKFAEVLEYRQRWYALGHSLGEIKYSLPLAPGETIQLAVIEWSRDDTASRYDRVRGTEYLQHELRRDRSIEESVDAGLKESQGGWSLMGGLSTGAAYDAGQYGKYTGNAAVGGSITNSWGERDLEADSLQDLHDKVIQGTSYVRSLTSTVIVQASQVERNALQTRRVANHNHCHALTIQYYEVLRHFRLQTEFVDRRKAVLIPFSPFAFTWQVGLRFRTLLEQALLDEALLPCFDALVRLHLASGVYDAEAPADSGTQHTTTSSAKKVLKKESVDVEGVRGEGVGSGITVQAGDRFTINAKGDVTFTDINPKWSKGPNGDHDEADHWFLAPKLKKYSLVYKIGENGPWQQGGTYSSAVASTTGEIVFGVNDTADGFGNNSGKWEVEVTYLAPETDETDKAPTVPNTVEPEAKPVQFSKAGDQLCQERLLMHLAGNQGYYNRAIWMLLDSTERRLYLEGALGDDDDILAAMNDTPIAVSGNYVAFAYYGPFPHWIEARDDDPDEPLESIVTLPTRGLFAEAQLGHCNSCEKRDVTRMWDWTQMTAEEPPAISGIQPGPQGQIPNLTPSQLPSNVIQITQPPAAPDPTGLANALALLKTPNIFRDMSGLDEVSVLLGKLVDGTTKTLEDMVKGASQAKQKVDAERAKAAVGGNGASQKQTPAERYDNLEVAKEVAKSADELGLNDQQKSDLSQDIIGGGGGGFLDQFLGTVLGATTSTARPLSVPGIRWCCQLGLNPGIEPGDVKDHRYGSTSTANCGYVYAEKAGLLDIGHIRDHIDLTKYVYDAILAGQRTIPCREGTAKLLQSPSDPIVTAQAIAYADSWSHELISFGGAQDFSAFAPEDLPSNFLGTYLGARALAMLGSSGSFDAIIDTLLTGVLASLGAHSKADTDAVIASTEAKWWDYALDVPPVKLLRRNFESTPWFAGAAFDKPPAPSFIDASTLTAIFSGFDYTSEPLEDGSLAKLADFPAITDKMRAPFKAAGTDKP